MNRQITLNELPAPFKVTTTTAEGITKYDIDNAYPTRMERIIDGSVTSKSSAAMLKRFLIGKGFVNPALNDIVVGVDRFGRDVTLYILLGKVARSISYFAGFYIRLQYDLNLKVCGLRYENFKHARFGELDSGDFSGKIVLYNNWDKQRSNGKVSMVNRRYTKSDWNYVDVYNANENAIRAQIAKAGEFEKWKGQVYFWFEDEAHIYPVSPVDPVLYDADTEKQISMFKNGEIRRGFFLKYIISHTEFDNQQDADEFKEKMGKLTGGGHSVSSLVMSGEFDENGRIKDGANVHVEPIKQNINDKLFGTYETSTANNIRKAYNAIPQILVDYEDSKLGTTSGEALRQASEFYNTQTEDIRKNIEQSFKQIMQNWKVDMSAESFEIEPLILGNGTTVDV